MGIKSYTELSKLESFEERFEYCKTTGKVGLDTFGGGRYLNQEFYRSPEWLDARDRVILRDEGCDLGIPGHEILRTDRRTKNGYLTDEQLAIVHHLNPITREQVLERDPCLFDLDNLILCSKKTHNAIHYSGKVPVKEEPIERKPYDTCPWRLT